MMFFSYCFESATSVFINITEEFSNLFNEIFFPKSNADTECKEFITDSEEKAIEYNCQGTCLTPLQKELFKHWIRCTCSPQWLVIRCQIILELNEGRPKIRIARELKKDLKTINKWEKRWKKARREISQLESASISPRNYRERIIAVLRDATRPGRPIVFTAEQVTQIIALACEVKDGSDRATSHWTWKDIAIESEQRGIVNKISVGSVGRFLSEARIKPHLKRYWMNAQPENSEQFEKKIREICELYHQAPYLFEQGIFMVSCDEKTGIQALERLYPTHAAKAGENKSKVELREHSYKRHGTLCLIANFMIATGKIVAPSIGPTRTEEDFVSHIKQTVDISPDSQWIFIVDQLNTHQSETLVRWVADECGISEDLGVKGRSGILHSLETRKIFLSDSGHRIRFVNTPKHCSWMNQVEIWFSILTRRLLKRGSFNSLEHLKERITKFIEFFNQTMAKPFKWTYKGRPLTV